ncbi:MAG: hypothetical protein JW940_07855 [Polyangiaceae bacterium]|nr:hypothetical protein [Polyangiaceae bacterium]
MSNNARGERSVCGCCREFVDDPAVLEQELPALLILSSAYGDTRGNQGICAVHECWVTPTLSCSGFRPRVPGQ